MYFLMWIENADDKPLVMETTLNVVTSDRPSMLRDLATLLSGVYPGEETLCFVETWKPEREVNGMSSCVTGKRVDHHDRLSCETHVLG